MSKGSKQRPLSVSQQQFADNWDRAFGKKEELREVDFSRYWKKGTLDFTKKTPDMLHEVNYDNMWQHSCTVEMGIMWIGKNETCNYCGAWEEDGL